MTDAELDAKIKDVALDCEDFYVGAVSLEFVAALTDLRAARAELAKVRTKSEERRRLLEEGQFHPDAFTRARCFGCGRRPCAEGCEVAAALKEEA